MFPKAEQQTNTISNSDIPSDQKWEVCSHFIKDMNNYGISVIDTFLGSQRGGLVFEEVYYLHKAGLFEDGQLVKNYSRSKEIRGDKVLWWEGNEVLFPNISFLVNEMDWLVKKSTMLPNNGKFTNYKIDSRTMAMITCYPGNGARYVKHVDNPNRDGRVLTAIYYLNKDWDPEIHGGKLRIFPMDNRRTVADIAPNFDRLLFFWSDRRNPHEVQPSFRTRYAITLWYYDTQERQLAKEKNRREQTEENVSQVCLGQTTTFGL